MSKSLRFCMVTTFYPPYHFGGDGICVHRLAEALARRGHRVDVVHSLDAYRLQHPAPPEIEFSHHPNVRVHALATRSPRASALAAHQLGRPGPYARELRELLGADYDVVHFHNISLLGGPRVLELGAGVKLCTAHDYWLVCPTHALFVDGREACDRRRCLRCTVLAYRRPPQAWRATGALPRSLEHVQRLIVPSLFSLEKHRRLGLEQPVVQLPFFVPEAGGNAVPGEPEPPDEPFFLYAGRLERLKGVHDLVRLFRSYDAAQLVVVGSGSQAAELQASSAGLPHVRFYPQLRPEALGAFYRRAIALLLPSLCYETFGLTLAECMCEGTPVIAHRIGALEELLEQSGGGLGFSDLGECRQAMERLRLDADLRAALGRRGQLAARTLWSESAHIDRYLALVRSLGGESPSESRLAAAIQ